MTVKLNCEDIMAFQEAIKELRRVDDRIIYDLNAALPTSSFAASSAAASATACAQLGASLSAAHKTRRDAVAACVAEATGRLERLRSADPPTPLPALNAARLQLRNLATEQAVEDIVAARSNKVQ